MKKSISFVGNTCSEVEYHAQATQKTMLSEINKHFDRILDSIIAEYCNQGLLAWKHYDKTQYDLHRIRGELRATIADLHQETIQIAQKHGASEVRKAFDSAITDYEIGLDNKEGEVHRLELTIKQYEETIDNQAYELERANAEIEVLKRELEFALQNT